MPAAIMLSTATFTMSAEPGTPSIQKHDPDALLRHDAFHGAPARRHRLADHAGLRFVVAAARGGGGKAVVAALPAFAMVRDACSASAAGRSCRLRSRPTFWLPSRAPPPAGLAIALDALGRTFLERASQIGMDPALLHRVAVISSGTLDSLPHDGAVVTLLSVCGSNHSEAYKDVFVAAIGGAIVALAVVVVLGSFVGSF
jgi:hypothetical protein